MALRIFARAIARVEEHGGRRITPAERAIVADIDTGPSGRGLALGQHRHRRVVAMHALAGRHARG